MLVLLTAPVPQIPPGKQSFDLPPLGSLDNFAQWRATSGFNINLTPPPPPFVQTAVYNTVLLSIPGGMFSIPGDPPS